MSQWPSPGRRVRDGGVSTVVGTLLILALITAGLVTYQLRWVPLQVDEREASHSAVVAAQLNALVASLDRQLERADNTTISSPITIGVEGRNFPWIPAVAHQFEVEGEPSVSPARGIDLDSTDLLVVETDGVDVSGVQETWTPFPADVADVASVRALRLRAPSIDDANGGQSASVQITGASGEVVGQFVVSVVVRDASFAVHEHVDVCVADCSVTPTYDTIYDAWQYNQRDEPAHTYVVDLMAPALRFMSLLEATEKPAALAFAGSLTGAEYALTYERQLAEGTVLAPAGGIVHAPYRLEMDSHVVTYRATNTQFVDQTYRVENGALVVAQTDGATFVVPPHIALELRGGTVHVTLTVPEVRAPTRDLTGVGAFALQTTVLSRSSLEAVSPDLTITVRTATPGLWENFISQALEDADVPADHYTLSVSGDEAVLELTGDPLNPSTVDDIHLTLERATIRLEVN